MATLTEQVLRFQQTGQGREELLALVAARAYAYPRCRGSRCEDDPGEFYLFCYPRLLRTLRRFRDQGKPFEWYLQSVLRWQYLVYVRVKRRQEQQWNAGVLPAFWEQTQSEGPASDPVPPHLSEPPCPGRARIEELAALFHRDGEGRVARPCDRTRLLAGVLKEVRLLPEPEVERLARLAAIPPSRLQQACRALRRDLEPKELRLEMLRERRTRAYAALCLLERELAREPEPAAREHLARRLERARRCLRRSQERIARVPVEPSNRQLAAALGLPKGTVDSALFNLKRRLAGSRNAEAA